VKPATGAATPAPSHARPLAWSAAGTAPRRPERPYDRARDLGPLLPLWPHEIADHSEAGCARILAKLRRALREERRRALSGDWTYNLTRHAGLFRAWRHETGQAASSHEARC